MWASSRAPRGREESIGDEVEVRPGCTPVFVPLPDVPSSEHLKGVDVHTGQHSVQHREEKVLPGNHYFKAMH